MKDLLKAQELYNKLKEEFEKGDPDSQLNKACKTLDDLAVFAMVRYASQEV